MKEQFNFYDFVGYVFPGALVLLFFCTFTTSFFGIKIPIDISSIGESLVFLGASYVLGHLVQVLGGPIEAREEKKWGGPYHDQYLRPEDNHYSKEFKSQLQQAVLEVFGQDLNLGLKDKLSASRRYETYRQCYALIVQKDIAQNTTIFLGVRGLMRGLTVAGYAGLFCGSLYMVKFVTELILKSSPSLFPASAFPQIRLSAVGVNGAMIVFSLVMIALSLQRLKRFSQHFADSIYRGFYIWWRLNSDGGPKPVSALLGEE